MSDKPDEQENAVTPDGDGVAAAQHVADAADSEPSIDQEADPVARIATLETELAELRDQYLRKSADFDNYRKRMLREKEEFAAYSNRDLLSDIVTIIDDFERAIRSADESKDFNAFHDGVLMIEKQFTGMLERKWNLVRFDSVDQEFDPQVHEAVVTEEREGLDAPRVAEDYQKGYMLRDRVLRPAKVKVAMPRSRPAGGEPAQDTNAEATDDPSGT